MHYLSISLTICFSIVFISVLSLSLSLYLLPLSLSLSHILFLFFLQHFNDVITSWGPHRLVVRTSRCGRDNPGSTPGVDIWYVWKSCIIRYPFATSNILRSLPFRCHRIFLLPCSPFVLLQISAVPTISPLFYFLSFFLSFFRFPFLPYDSTKLKTWASQQLLHKAPPGSKLQMTAERFELPTFWSGVRRATVAPYSQLLIAFFPYCCNDREGVGGRGGKVSTGLQGRATRSNYSSILASLPLPVSHISLSLSISLSVSLSLSLFLSLCLPFEC